MIDSAVIMFPNGFLMMVLFVMMWADSLSATSGAASSPCAFKPKSSRAPSGVNVSALLWWNALRGGVTTVPVSQTAGSHSQFHVDLNKFFNFFNSFTCSYMCSCAHAEGRWALMEVTVQRRKFIIAVLWKWGAVFYVPAKVITTDFTVVCFYHAWCYHTRGKVAKSKPPLGRHSGVELLIIALRQSPPGRVQQGVINVAFLLQSMCLFACEYACD